MIEKVENPLGFQLEQVEMLISELQKTFDEQSKNLPECLSLEESGVAYKITTKSSSHYYNLEQLKLLKIELLDPLMNSLKEVS